MRQTIVAPAAPVPAAGRAPQPVPPPPPAERRAETKDAVHEQFAELEDQDAIFDFLVEIMALAVMGDLFQYYDDHSQLFRIIAYFNRTFNTKKDRDEAVKKSKIALKKEKERAEAKAEAKTEETNK